MKKTLSGLALGLTLLLAAAGCGSKAAGDGEKIVIGSMGSDAQIWKHIAQSQAAKDAKLNIEVKEIDGGVVTNNATKEGEVDVNAFQSWGYLVSYNRGTANILTIIYAKPSDVPGLAFFLTLSPIVRATPPGLPITHLPVVSAVVMS
ncbi:MetQ/NlpA family ABC transporter substrate-binding protein [Paenibacillus azoreducens]|uniref:MetQ/NlpA family ABC transporter substrate-binding protein n=1 Tax=Paenibacillus azoreducens TaxID=116718 RepID=UPI0039F4D9C5